MKYQVHDLVYVTDAIVRVTRADDQIAWYTGQPLDRSHGLVTGWMRQSAGYLILKRNGQFLSQEAEAIYQQALRQFPSAPWDTATARAGPKITAFLERRAKAVLASDNPQLPSDHAAN